MNLIVSFSYDNFMNNLEKFKDLPLTYTLMAVSILFFLLTTINDALADKIFVAGALHGYSVVVKGEIYRLVTSTFLHSGGMHIVMNMLSLYIVGKMVERLFSKTAYLSIYFISAFFGAFTSIYMHLDGVAVGASGAIFGLFGALAGFVFVHKNTMAGQFKAFMKDFGMILLINLGIGFAFPSIDVSAHVGGLLAGIVGGFVIAKNPKFVGIYVGLSLFFLVGFYNYLYSMYANILSL